MPPAAEPLGHDGAAAGQLSDLEQAAAADERRAQPTLAPTGSLPGEAAAGPNPFGPLPTPRRPSPSRRTSSPTMPITASTNITTSHFVLRRASD